MTEPEYKSECCGVDVYLESINITQFYIDGHKDRHYICRGCHQPCTVRKEEGE